VRGMHDPLPPDLARLGDQLAAATARAGARARRNARLARLGVTGAVATLALAVFAPGVLHPTDGTRTLAIAAASTSYRPMACDQPRGATFAAARPCAAPGTTDATPGGLARRLATH
jgi:hypothetical protein